MRREWLTAQSVTDDDLEPMRWAVEDGHFWHVIDSARAPYPGPTTWVDERGTGCLAARSDLARCDRPPFRNTPFCDFHFGSAWAAMVAVADVEQREHALRVRNTRHDLFLIAEQIDEAAYRDALDMLKRSPERVYFFRSGHAVKIGRSVKVEARIKSLRSSLTPDDVDAASGELLGTIVGGNAVERELHRRFRQHRLAGEWFTYEPIADAIVSLLTDGEQVAA